MCKFPCPALVHWCCGGKILLLKWVTAHWCGSTFGLSCSAPSVFAGLALPWWQAFCNTATVNYQVNAATLKRSSVSYSLLCRLLDSLCCFSQVLELLHVVLCTFRVEILKKRLRMVHVPVHSSALPSFVSLDRCWLKDGFYKHAQKRITVKIHDAQEATALAKAWETPISPHLPHI